MKKLFIILSLIILGCSCISAQPASKIYFTRFNEYFGRVYSMDLDGSNDVILVNNIDRPNPIAIDWNSSPKKIYVALNGDSKIVRYDIDGSNPTDVITGITSISDIELDLFNRKIFWVKDSATEEKISKGDMDGTNQNITDVYVSPSATNDDWWGIALDVPNQLLYLTIRGNVHIDSEVWRMTTSGGSRTKLFDGGDDAALDNPHDIEYYNGYIYWGDDSGILRGNTDGTVITNSIASATGNIGLAIDATNNRIYWTTSSSVKGADLDGGNESTLFNASSPLQGIDTDYNPAALPVELTAFTAEQTDAGIMLKWETATEINNYGFEIERSNLQGSNKIDDDNNLEGYRAIGFVQGHGNSNSPKSYEYLDHDYDQDQELILKYRLKQIDTDGTFEYYSTIASIDLSLPTNINDNVTLSTFNLEQNYPNPFNPATTIQYSIPLPTLNLPGLHTGGVEVQHVTIKVYDILGNEVAALVNESQKPGSYSIEWDASAYSSGFYIYQLTYGTKQITKKMLMLK
jgi:hypothetical protein